VAIVISKRDAEQDQLSNADQAQRRDDALRRALAMPPKRHKARDMVERQRKSRMSKKAAAGRGKGG
jgi:hypothetical protein